MIPCCYQCGKKIKIIRIRHGRPACKRCYLSFANFAVIRVQGKKQTIKEWKASRFEAEGECLRLNASPAARGGRWFYKVERIDDYLGIKKTE